jgi:hypothetical protein
MSINSENNFDKPESDWIYPGAWVVHDKFGKGKIQSISEYKNTPMLVIEFSFGEKMLSKEHGIPHLAPWEYSNDQGEELKSSVFHRLLAIFRK